MTDQNIILSTTEKQENNVDEATPRSSPDVESQTIPDDRFFAHVSTRLTTPLHEPVCSTSHFLEAELLLLSFATGILDGVSFPEFSCFTSRQNGNTVLFAIAALKIPTRGIGSRSGGDRFLQHSRGYKTHTIDSGVIGVVFRHASRSRPWTGSQRYYYGDGDG
ncbi:hypothetical protein D6D13_07658 [Aureobasidium pullulans]|uniref:Uncharacterized protein n=1 Tax=Aureobasidium pullulans TaxID=5580 RepID=A0A4S9CCI3_AURPU|nr:hypothetical protein D6D13_07658 [Aureobasidium pullulans]